MGKRIKILWNILVSGLITLGVLSVFCLFYNYDGAAVADETGAAPMKREPNQIMGYMLEGFSLKRADENGFYNVPEAVWEQPQILLMGDSHVEAKQMPSKYSMGALLNEHYSTYSIGVSANELGSCVYHLKNAVKAYEPTDYVILQTSYCHLSENEMQQVIREDGRAFTETPGRLSLISKWVPASSALFFQLKNWLDTSEPGIPAREKEAEKQEKVLTETYLQTLEQFLQKAAQDAKGSGAELIIFRMPSCTVDENGEIQEEEPLEQQALKAFETICPRYEIRFVDMKPAFAEKYRKEKILTRGFCNTIPGKGHLNRQGHQVVAETLIALIENEQQNRLSMEEQPGVR